MPRVKSAYRRFKDGGRVNEVRVDTIPGDVSAPEAALPGEADAASALKDQAAAIKAATAHQRHHEAAPALDPAQAATLAHWRANGLPERDAEFLAKRPDMLEFPAITGVAANEAIAAGHPQGTDAFFHALESRFEHHMQQMRAMPAAAPPESAPARTPASAPAPAAQPTPQFFEPPSLSEPEPDRSAIVSAPVTRDVPTGGGRSYQPGPDSIRLTAEERHIARASGISETQYATNKLRMLREQAEGTRQR